MELKPLTPELWVGQSQLYFTNTGVFARNGKACLIDPCMFPHEIDVVARFVKARQLVVDSILITHSHWDHILGPEHFPGVKVVAQSNYATETVDPLGARILAQISKWEKQHNIKRTQPFVLPKADEVFAEKGSLSLSDVQLELTHAPGHAADQLVAYHSERKLLWASDILSDVEIPFVSHSIQAYKRTLEMLSAWDVDILIPGHGHPSTSALAYRERVQEDQQYLAELRQRVEDAVKKEHTVEETVQKCQSMAYRNPDENRGPHRLNVESVYVELGGQADPDQVGWGKASLGLD